MPRRPMPSATAGTPVRAALAAWIGSALEYYDFFIYGTAAALTFGTVFFPDTNPGAGTLLALSTFGVGYVTRPLGGLILGHIGDRVGRKRVLLWCVLTMGVATFLVGCLPGYDQAGIASPILLVLIRLLQGLSAGGEQAGANSMSLEHAPATRRGYYTSFTLVGTQCGQILATAVFLPITALPREDLLSWGWRVPFWLSAVVAVVGFGIRRSLEETPVFRQESSVRRAAALPVMVLLRKHWADVLRVVLASTIASVQTIFTVYALSYAVHSAQLSENAMLWVGVVSNVVALPMIPLWARLSDRMGRKPVFIGGALACAVLMPGYFAAISAGSYVLVFLGGIVLFGIAYSAANAVWPAYYSEQFRSGVRLSGTAVGTQVGFGIAGFVPTVAKAVSGGAAGWLPVAALVAFVCVLAAGAVASGRETHRTATEKLGLEPTQARSCDAVPDTPSS